MNHRMSRSRRYPLVACLLALVIWCSAGDRARAADATCPGTKLNLLSPHVPEAREICAGARIAEAFFSACGFPAKQRYDVRVSETVESLSGARLYGQFQPSRKLVSLVTLAASKALVASISDADTMRAYKIVPPAELYRALAAHEIAHAITHQNLTARPSVALYEYIGAVVQITALPDGTRKAYLRRFDGQADTASTTFNDVIAFMEPAVFGASAYQHFNLPDNGCRFLKRLLTEWDVFPQMSIVRGQAQDRNGPLAAIEHGPRSRSPAAKE